MPHFLTVLSFYCLSIWRQADTDGCWHHWRPCWSLSASSCDRRHCNMHVSRILSPTISNGISPCGMHIHKKLHSCSWSAATFVCYGKFGNIIRHFIFFLCLNLLIAEASACMKAHTCMYTHMRTCTCSLRSLGSFFSSFRFHLFHKYISQEKGNKAEEE